MFFGFVQVHVNEWLLVILPNPIPKLQHAPLPPKCCESRSMPQLLIFLLFSPQIHIWIYQGAWECAIKNHGFTLNNQPCCMTSTWLDNLLISKLIQVNIYDSYYNVIILKIISSKVIFTLRCINLIFIWEMLVSTLYDCRNWWLYLFKIRNWIF